MAKCLNLIDVISILANGGRVTRVEPVPFGRISYEIFLPSDSVDIHCGHISDMTAEKIWNLGFLVAPHNSRRVDGKVITDFVFSKPDVSRFISKSSAAADENK